jgi:hypothetical protein
MYQHFIISNLYEAQHVSGDTPPIIKGLKLHRQPLVFYTWKVVGHVVGGRCQAQYMSNDVILRYPSLTVVYSQHIKCVEGH